MVQNKANKKKEFTDFLEKTMKKGKIPKGICVCCGHKLDHHIDERDGWRCHSLGSDFYQCECFLRKGRYDNGIDGYDLRSRVNKHADEFKRGVG